MRILFFVLIFLLVTVFAYSARETRLDVKKSGNRYEFIYDMEGEPGEEVDISVWIRINGKVYSQEELSLSGDLKKVKPGKDLKVYWDVLKDFPRGLHMKHALLSLVAGGGKEYKDTVTGMEFVLVKGGCYKMGDTFGDGESNEKPVHEVCVDNFYMGKYEVTNAEYRKYKSSHDSKDYKGYSLNSDNQPVVEVSWKDAKGFAGWLSERTGRKYRLPTEAEWEYAARAGTTTRNYWGNGKDEACVYASVADQTAKRQWNNWEDIHNCSDGYAVSAPVGSFKPNAFGLYDMMGNVWEWVEDVYSDVAYSSHSRNNPIYVGRGDYRVMRGGSWGIFAGGLRASFRYSLAPDGRDSNLGFRLVLDR